MNSATSIIFNIACVLALLLSAGYGMLSIKRSSVQQSRQLMTYYALYCLVLVAEGIHFLTICSSEEFSQSIRFSPLALGMLCLFPLLYFLVRTVAWCNPPGKVLHAICLVPSVLFIIVTLILHLTQGMEQIITWTTSVYDYFLFFSVILGCMLIAWTSSKYSFRVRNYHIQKCVSDYHCVMNISRTAVMAGGMIYVALIVASKNFVGNWPLTALAELYLCFIIIYLGRTLCTFKGVYIPDSVDWSRHTLTPEEINLHELRIRHTEELASAQSASMNIGETIECWVKMPHPSYLNTGITIADAAGEMGIPVSILSGYINKTLNMNFNQWINMFRIKHVKQLLITTNMTLDEIAMASGFATRNLLSRNFKSQEGISPSEFKKQNT